MIAVHGRGNFAAFLCFLEDSNTVGYTTTDTDAGKWSILGVQFEETNGGMHVNGLVSGLTGVDYDDSGTWKNTAPQIQVPNSAGGYTLYYYLNDAWDGSKGVPGWANSMGDLADTGVFTPGVAVWLKSVQLDATASVAGAVPETDSATVSCPENFALRANVYPEAVTINSAAMTSSDISGVDYDDGGTWKNTAPQIQVPNSAGGYTLYYYLNDAWDGSKGVPGWANSMGDLASGTIPAAQGFWTKGVSAPFTLRFAK